MRTTKSTFGNLGCVVLSHTSQGLTDKHDNILIPVEYDWVTVISKDFVVVRRGDKEGLFSLEGRELLPVEYDGFTCLAKTRLMKVLKDNKYGVVNRHGGLVANFVYEVVDELSHNKIRVIRDEAPRGRVITIEENLT